MTWRSSVASPHRYLRHDGANYRRILIALLQEVSSLYDVRFTHPEGHGGAQREGEQAHFRIEFSSS
jgi:hypothetical protein